MDDDIEFSGQTDTPAPSSYDETDAAQGFRPGTHERDITPEELAALKNQQAVGAAPSDGQPSPGFALQANVRDGKFYDPSGRQVSSIGESPEQAAARFGAALPMNQRDLQQLSQLEQSYGQLLNNPNIEPRAKHAMLHDMARQIQYGHWRMNYQQQQQKMQARGERQQLMNEQIQNRHAVSANEAGLMTGDANHFASTINDLQKQFPGHDVEYSSKNGVHIKPKAAPKPEKAEKAPDAVKTVLEEQRAVTALEKSFGTQPKDVQKMFKDKYGDDAAARGWATERLDEVRKRHQSAGAVKSAGQQSAPAQAPQSSLEQRAQVQTAIGESHQRDLAKIEAIARPEEREAKRGALTQANQLLMQYTGKAMPEPVQTELRRLKGILTQSWPAAGAAPRYDNEAEANRFAGGT